MTSPLYVALGVVLGGAGGVIAHELTHYVFAALFRRSPRMHPATVEISWKSDGRDSDRIDGLIGCSPVLVGVVALPLVAYALVAVGGALAVSAAVAWVFYTAYVPYTPIGASKEDIEFLRLLLLGRQPRFDSSEGHQGSDLPQSK